MKNTVFTFLLIAFTLIIGCHRGLDNVDCSKINAAYSTDIKPLINANCISSGCHNAGSSNGDFSQYSGLKTVAENGKLDERVIGQQDMPPSKKLSLDERKKIKCWIKSGAPNN